MGQNLLQSDAGVKAVPSLKVPVFTDVDLTTLAAELDKAKVRIAKLESTGTITVRQYKEIIEEGKKRRAVKSVFQEGPLPRVRIVTLTLLKSRKWKASRCLWRGT